MGRTRTRARRRKRSEERAEPAEQRAPAPEDKLGEAQAEAARLREQLLRTAADFDNFRKRSRREVEDAQRRGRETIREGSAPGLRQPRARRQPRRERARREGGRRRACGWW